MAGIRGKDTKPEIAVRKMLHKAGFRFRLHRKDLPGRPDIVLPKHHVVVFVNGCFWHGHDGCALYRQPSTRSHFWVEKISSNQARDARNREALVTLGWRIVTVWECALKGRLRLPNEYLADLLENGVKSGNQMVDLIGAR